MKKQKGLTIEELKLFAANYAAGQESAGSENSAAVIAEIKADPKKFAEKAGQVPEIVSFLLDQRLIPKDQMMEYYMKISWLEHRDVILQLKDYESGKKRTGSTQPAAAAEVEDTGKTEAQLKAEWKTEKCEDGTLRLLSYKGTDEVVEVPRKIGKAAVSEIGAFAFSPAQPRLKSEQKPGRERIREIRIGEGVRALGESCFEACLGLRKVTLPKELKEIPKRAFAECRALETVELPESLKKLGFESFCSCEKLTEIRLPDSLLTFAAEKPGPYDKAVSRSFADCKNLRTITFPKTMKSFPAALLYGCSALESVTLPDTIKTIERSAFSHCASLKMIELPNGMEQIKEDAFEFCTSLKELKLPESIKKLAASIFTGSALTELRLPPSLESLGEKDSFFGFRSALSGSQLVRLILPIRTLAQYEALQCGKINIPSLREFVLENTDGELAVKDGALYTADRKRLLKTPASCGKEFTVPAEVEQIDAEAFQYSQAKTVIMPDSVKRIGKACFYKSAVETVLLPADLESLPDMVFYSCVKLKKISIPVGVKEVGELAFYECEALEQITIPGNIGKIGKNAFSECKKLREVMIEEGVKEIGTGAFCRCRKLEKIVIPASVNIMKDGIQRWDALFYECKNLTIYGFTGSTAERYAKEHWVIKFEAIG